MSGPAEITATNRVLRRTRPVSSSPTQRPYPTVLLSAVGTSPQVVTETLYCLLVQARPPVDIQEVHILTTCVGAEQVRKRLLHPRDGWFHRFCREYRIPAGRIRFDAHTIHIPAGTDGKPLEDVRTPEDNARVADEVLALVRGLTRDPAIALHVSVAGGRKTMGLLLGIAFQLCARPQDRLSHVLVSPPDLEGRADFFYPPPAPTTFKMKGKGGQGRGARVELAEIPLLLLREKIQPAGLEGLGYTELIRQGQQEMDRLAAPPALILDPPSRMIHIAGDRVRLTPLECAVYQLFTKRRRACGQDGCAGCAKCAVEAHDFLEGPVLEELRGNLRALGIRNEEIRSLRGWATGGDERFLQVRSRIERKLRDVLGHGSWVARYCIAGRRESGETTRYHLPLDPRQVLCS